MARAKFCPLCQRQVVPKKMSILVFILLLFIGILPGLIYWAACHGKKCPICGCKI